MKFNLKNRPTYQSYVDTPDDEEYYDTVQKWFEGFEKELKQMYRKRQLIPADIIKEILGE